jgi:hypothetical protein
MIIMYLDVYGLLGITGVACRTSKSRSILLVIELGVKNIVKIAKERIESTNPLLI